MTAACTALIEHPRLRELWPEYLVLQHQIIRATVPLTEAALERARELPEADPLREPLASYLDEHVDEELHHDDGLLDDLDSLGVSRADALGRFPSSKVATLVGAQYYWIHHHHPVAFLGYVALMEGYPPTPELLETLTARTGYRWRRSAPSPSTRSSTRATAITSTGRSTPSRSATATSRRSWPRRRRPRLSPQRRS